MKPLSLAQRKALGALLVALQFACMLVLPALALPALRQGTLPAATLLLGGASLALMAWTLLHNRLGNFNIRPLPKAYGSLVTSGPYRWIRHPMYTAVLLGGAALAWMSDPAPGWTVWACLALVVFVKSTFEERWMREQHPAYGDYAARSKRFVPLIF
jgi:protein-S-isoprenylcysteine O-methyltransferase Ste14